MSELKVCRICLNTNIRLFNYDNFHLKQYYEEVMATKLDDRDGLPNQFCYECAAMLQKFHKFKEKCYIGNEVLTKLLWKGPITLESIKNIDRHKNNLRSSIQIMIKTNKTVKACRRRYKEGQKKKTHNKVKPCLDKRKERQKNRTIKKVKPCLSKRKERKKNRRVKPAVIRLPKVPEVIYCDSNHSSDDESLAEYKKSQTVNEKTNIDPEINFELVKVEVNMERVSFDEEIPPDVIETIGNEVNDTESVNSDPNLIIDEDRTEFENENIGSVNSDANLIIDEDRPEFENENTKSVNSDTNLIIDEDRQEFENENSNSDANLIIDEDRPTFENENSESINGDANLIIDEDRPEFENENPSHEIDNKDTSEFVNENPSDEQDNETIKDIILELRANSNKKNKRSSKNKNEPPHKLKKFEMPKKNFLDPEHWSTVNLSEEEAFHEFQARAQDRKYVSAAFKCTNCYRGFSKEEMLVRHRKLRHSETLGQIECKFCGTRYKWKCQLTKHIVEHYVRYKCLRCNLVCPLKNTAIFHNDYHNGVVRKCAHCGDEFKHLSTYYTHLRTHRSEHVCTLCGASFVSAAGLRHHKHIKHVDQKTEVTQGKDEYCLRCDIKFETRQAYEEHLLHSAKHVDGLDEPELEPTPSKPKKPRQRQKPQKKPTDCHMCGKHFATLVAYKKHHLAEHPRMPAHAPTERQICEICGLSLAPGSVASHLNTHTRAKVYECETCNRQFSCKIGLTNHQLSHSAEKRVKCPLCEKRFKQNSSMKLHYRTFHLKEPYPKRNRRKRMYEYKEDDYVHEASDGPADCFNSKYFFN